MKTLTKGLLSLALTLLCLATLLAVIGSAMGGDAKDALRYANVQTENGNGFGFFTEFDSFESDNFGIQGQTETGTVTQVADGFEPTTANQFTINGTTHTISQLNIDMGGVKTTKIVLGNGFGVSGNNLDETVKISAKDGCLSIKTNTSYNWDDNNETITITLPKNAVYETVNIKLGAGKMQIADLAATNILLEVEAGSMVAKTITAESLWLNVEAGSIKTDAATAKTAEIAVGAGSLVMKSLTVDTLSTSVQAGSAKLEEFAATTVNFSVDAGSIKAEGDIAGKAAFNVSAGSINLKLEEPDSFGWALNCQLGNCNIDGEKFSGMNLKNSVNETATIFYDITCQLGSVNITFD